MNFAVDIWLRGNDFATTETITTVAGEPRAWTEDDVRDVLGAMLRAMDRSKNPDQPDRPIALRGLSWIVNPYETGVVIALEITLGAAVAGPFNIDQATLEGMITRVLARPAHRARPQARRTCTSPSKTSGDC